MTPLAPPRAWFASLDAGDTEALHAHWMRLSEECLRRRFLGPVGADYLARRARAVFAENGHAIGWFRDGVLRGVAELYPLPGGAAEASFTVEPAFRAKGVGHGLFRRVLTRARNLGLSQVVIYTMRDNRPMIRIAERAGAEMHHEPDEVTAICRLDRPDAASLAADALSEAGGAAAGLANAAARILAGWGARLPAGPIAGGAPAR